MTRKLFFSAALALTLAGGAVATAGSAPAVAVAPAAAQAVSAPVAAAAVAQSAAAVQLNAAQMATVQGAGFFSWVKKQFKKIVKKVIGAIVSIIINLIRDWIEQAINPTDGGQEDQQTETVTENYNTQAEYDAGNVSSTANEQGAWATTSSWGDGYTGGGGCDLSGGGEMNAMMMQRESTMTVCN